MLLRKMVIMLNFYLLVFSLQPHEVTRTAITGLQYVKYQNVNSINVS